jgi:molecular chaperone HtpG
MSERVDEWAMNFVQEFDGTPLQNVSKGAVDLGDLQDAEEKKALEQAAEQFKPVVEKLGESLKDKTKEVRVTTFGRLSCMFGNQRRTFSAIDSYAQTGRAGST